MSTLVPPDKLKLMRELANAEKLAAANEERRLRWHLLGIPELSEVLPPVPWVCEGLALAPGAVSLVAGYGYSRKTMALQSMALSVAAGKRVWGVYSSRQGRALHLDYEQGRRLTQERYQRLARGMGFELKDLDPRTLELASMPHAYLDDKGVTDDLLAMCDGCALVIVDSLRAAFQTVDENSSEVRGWLDLLSRVSERTGAAFVVIHHARKPNQQNTDGATFSIRGSSALFDACQTVYVFEGEKDKPTKVHHQKDRIRGATVDTFGLMTDDIALADDPRWGLRVRHMEDVELRDHADGVESARAARAVDDAEKRILTALGRVAGVWRGPLRSLQKTAKIGTEAFDDAIARLTTTGRMVKGGSYHHPEYSLANPHHPHSSSL